MALETFNLVKDLDINSPAGGDSRAQGDDHIRGIKKTIKNQFTSLEGPVTVTAAQLNDVVALRSELNTAKTDLTKVLTLAGGIMSGPIVAPAFTTPPSGVINAGLIQQNGVRLIPVGTVVMWYGDLNAVPAGWYVCNGTNGTPDLRNRFIVGAGAAYGVGVTGGVDTHNVQTSTNGHHNHTGVVTAGGYHTHGGTVGHTALGIEHIPAHQHGMVSNSGGGGGLIEITGNYGNTNNYILRMDGTPSSTVGFTSATGSGHGHTHGIAGDGEHTHGIQPEGGHAHTISFDNRPSFFALAFLMFKG
ncbi:phage tail protein [Teichococcus vastitatis]|uniref:Phage tail protein n=1 Tax=Teichococcus vastitatis TaxID=2307076 RepID=A0ABS9WCF4_9PROT|nr:phage tail protein [Pseudoroseomonas vastitatis]MCI0756683.1 phage tail protein [Pseudoroseomonas vastitatis]